MQFSKVSHLGWASSLMLSATVAAWADAKGDLTAAAKKLEEAKNYAWTTTTDIEGMPFKPGPTEGKRVRDGFTWVSSEMMGNKSEAYLMGNKGVVQQDGEWKTESELPQFGGPGGPGGPGGRAPGGEKPNDGPKDRPNAGGPGGGGRRRRRPRWTRGWPWWWATWRYGRPDVAGDQGAA